MSVHLLLAAPDAAHVTLTAGGYVLGAGRTAPTIAAVLGLISVVLGVVILSRSARRAGQGRALTVTTLATAAASVTVGALHMASSAGGLGTGNGLAGAFVAVVLGVLGLALGGLALTRSRRVAGASSGHGTGSG